MTSQPSLLPVVSSPLKWVGSKQWLAPKLSALILPLLPVAQTYHELFAGSAALFFSLRSQGWKGEAILSDKVTQLIWLYHDLRHNQSDLFAEIHCLLTSELELSDKQHSDFYLKIRKAYNEQRRTMGLTQSARFLYLNYRGFNGLYRENKQGEYTVAYGGRREYFPSPESLLAASAALQNTKLFSGDFSSCISDTNYSPGDVVFADPPYDGTYTGYAGGFSAEDQARLATHLRSLSERGVHVFATNADTPLIRDLYQWAQIEVLTTRYTVGGKRERVNEVLIRGRA